MTGDQGSQHDTGNVEAKDGGANHDAFLAKSEAGAAGF